MYIDKRTWHFTTYEDYSQKLLESLPKDPFCNLEFGIIKDYAEYVNSFSKYLKKKIPLNIQNEKWNSVLCSDKKLKSIRMDDIWQKLIANHILIRLCEKCIEKKLITDNSKYTVGSNAEDFILGQKNKNGRIGPNLNTIHVGAGFSRGTGLVEIKIHISDNCLFGIQIQNGYYKRLLETVKGNECVFENKLSNLNGLFNYENDKIKTIWYDDNNNILKGPVRPKPDKKGNANIKGFGGYGTTFIAQWKKISDDATVDAVLNAVLNDCNKVRSIIKV